MEPRDPELKNMTVESATEHVATALGYGPGGKPGGVIIIVVDHNAGQNFLGHAGGDSPMFDGILFAVKSMVARAAQLIGGGTGKASVSSVRQWRERQKKS